MTRKPGSFTRWRSTWRAGAQLPENVKVDGQLDVVGNVGEGAQDVRRAAGANGSPGAKFNSMSPHSSSSVEPRSRAQRVPGGVFKKYDVEAVVVAAIPRTLGRVGTIRRRDRGNVYLLNPHFVLANISNEQWQCFASLQSRCQNWDRQWNLRPAASATRAVRYRSAGDRLGGLT